MANQKIKPRFDLQLFADGKSVSSDFLSENKITTKLYRKLLAHAVGETGTIDRITKMAFGDQGETDDSGQPAVPSSEGDLNHTILTVDISSVEFTDDNIVCFTGNIEKGGLSGTVNEVALLSSSGETACKMRLASDKGVDSETSLQIKWSIEF